MRTCQYCVGQYQYRNIVLKVFTKQFFGVIWVSAVLVKNIKTNKKGVLKFCNTNIREVVLNTTYTQQGHNLHFDMCSVASNICSMQCTLCTVQLVYPLELSNPSWHVDTPDHYCWSTLGIVVSLTCQPGLAPSTVATSYNRLCCLQMINLGLAYGIMIQAECIPMFVTINQHFIFSYQECTLCVGLFS